MAGGIGWQRSVLFRITTARRAALVRLVGLAVTVSALGVAPTAQARKPPSVTSTAAARDYQAARKLFYELKSNQKQQQYRHPWLKVIGAFRRIAVGYPQTEHAARAWYTTAELWRDMHRISRRSSDLDEAYEAYHRVVVEHPKSTLADDALWQRAQIAMQRASKASQRNPDGPVADALYHIATGYGGGDMANRAAQLARELGLPKRQGKPVAKPFRLFGRKATPREGRPVLKEVKHWDNPDYSRIAIYLSVPTQARIGRVPANPKRQQPERLYVDLQQTRLPASGGYRKQVDDQLLRQLRVAQFDPRTVRVVLELKQQVQHRVLVMENPYRIVLDAVGAGASLEASSASPAASASASASASTSTDDDTAAAESKALAAMIAKASKSGKSVKPSKAVASKSAHKSSKPETKSTKSTKSTKRTKTAKTTKTTTRKPTRAHSSGRGAFEARGNHVVLDAGHGGHDSGTRSRKGLLEKDVVMQITRKVARRLRAGGARVSLTRDGDKTLALEERTALANRLNADVFVSIHANAAPQRSVRGVETYYLNVTDDRYALRLAATENSTSEEQVSDLQLILADLSTKANTTESRSLAQRVQKAVMRHIKPVNPKARDLGVKASLFYVLLGARMPAILVETAFLSNPTEARLVGQASYQNRVAQGIAQAVLSHLNSPMQVVRQ